MCITGSVLAQESTPTPPHLAPWSSVSSRRVADCLAPLSLDVSCSQPRSALPRNSTPRRPTINHVHPCKRVPMEFCCVGDPLGPRKQRDAKRCKCRNMPGLA